MRRLMEDFDALFELGHEVDGTPLGELLDAALAEVENARSPDWGRPGATQTLECEAGRFVSFFYRPHLFPAMELKLRLAHELQYHLLPRDLPPDSPLRIASVLESYCHLSGDLFGWETLPDGRLLLWIVDMAGHGVRAGLTSAVLKLLLKRTTARGDIGSILNALNASLHGCTKERARGRFATGFFAAFSRDGSARYASAGHPPVLLRRADGRIEELPSIDLPLGMFERTEYGHADFRLERGDTLLLYTDGLVESSGRDGEFFGLERLRGLLDRERDEPEDVTEAIYRAIGAWQDLDLLDDDVTFLAAMRRDPA